MDGFSDFVLNCSKAEMSEKRHTLSEQINGDMFYNISSWPRDIWFYFDLHFKKYVYLDGTPRYLTN